MSKKENLTRILLCVFMIAATLGICSWANSPRIIDATVNAHKTNDAVVLAYNDNTVQFHQETENKASVDTVEIKDSIKNDILIEVKNYIKNRAPKSHDVIAQEIVNNGLEHNIDLCFMMGQTQIETNFGTTGIGRNSSRKSIFGVYCTYRSYEAAINDYCTILKKSYLVNGKTEMHLLNNYVTKGGARYAENRKYESHLRTAYNSIKKSTKIYELQRQYKKLG